MGALAAWAVHLVLHNPLVLFSTHIVSWFYLSAAPFALWLLLVANLLLGISLTNFTGIPGPPSSNWATGTSTS